MNQPRDPENSSIDKSRHRLNAALPTTPELEQSLQSLQRGVADAEAGRLVDSNEAIDATRNRIQRTG